MWKHREEVSVLAEGSIYTEVQEKEEGGVSKKLDREEARRDERQIRDKTRHSRTIAGAWTDPEELLCY